MTETPSPRDPWWLTAIAGLAVLWLLILVTCGVGLALVLFGAIDAPW